jgi:hypothetical protein
MIELKKTSEDVISYFEKIESNFTHPFNINYVFLTNDKSKKLIKVSKIPKPYEFILDAQILVTFNENFFENFEDQTKTILIEQELDKIECDALKDEIKINNNSLINTSSGIIEKFTLDLVKNANRLEREYLAQLKEKEKENKEGKKTKKNKRL